MLPCFPCSTVEILGELLVYCSPSLFAIAVLLIVSYPFQRCVSVVSLFIYFVIIYVWVYVHTASQCTTYFLVF